MLFSKTIQMLIFNGDPNGMIMCELSNWNGRVYKISRNQISDFANRKDANNTGVYFLLGKDDANQDNIYIGEAEKIIVRLKQHFSDKDYWNDCICVISKDNLLNKAHVKYLENSFFALAQQSGRASLINDTTPTKSSIDEYDEAMLLEFLSNTKMLVNTLGYKVFDTIDETVIPPNKAEGNTFFITAARGANAKGMIVADGFVVLKGSIIANTIVNSISPSLINNRQNLIEKCIIDSQNMFVKDYVFSSPSLAAGVVMGRNANGRTEWKNSQQQSIKEIEEAKISELHE